MALSKSSSSALLDRVSCGVCMEQYDNTIHVPKILPCQHTFCLCCLTSLSANTVYCPVCRCQHNVLPRGFTTNRAVLDIMEEMQQDASSKPAAVVLDCKEHSNTECILVCIDCTVGLCIKCMKKGFHHGHQLEELSDAKAVIRPKLDKQIEGEITGLELKMSLINKSPCSVQELTTSECDMKAMCQKLETVFSLWRDDQLSVITRCKQEAVSRKNDILYEQGKLQSLLEQKDIDIGSVVARLSTEQAREKSRVQQVDLAESESFNFVERAQSLLKNLLSVLDNDKSITSRFLKQQSDAKLNMEVTIAKPDASKHRDIQTSVSTATEGQSASKPAVAQAVASKPAATQGNVTKFRDNETASKLMNRSPLAFGAVANESKASMHQRPFELKKVAQMPSGLVCLVSDDLLYYRFKSHKCKIHPKDSPERQEHQAYLEHHKDQRKNTMLSKHIENIREFYVSF